MHNDFLDLFIRYSEPNPKDHPHCFEPFKSLIKKLDHILVREPKEYRTRFFKLLVKMIQSEKVDHLHRQFCDMNDKTYKQNRKIMELKAEITKLQDYRKLENKKIKLYQDLDNILPD